MLTSIIEVLHGTERFENSLFDNVPYGMVPSTVTLTIILVGDGNLKPKSFNSFMTEADII